MKIDILDSLNKHISARKPEAKAAPVAEPVIDPLMLRPLPPVQYPMFPQYPLVKR